MIGWDASLLREAARHAPEPTAALALATLERWPEVEEYDALVATPRLRAAAPGLSFVRQAPRTRRRRGEPQPGYDEEIAAGRVPTRPRSWHDLFNALIWSALPGAKRALHGRQRRLIAGRAGHFAGVRSREQDALAMLDEGGLLLVCGAADEGALDEALASGSGLDGLTARGAVRPVIFGHALLEHLSRGHRAMRGFPLKVVADPADLSAIDGALSVEVERLGPPGDRPGLAVPAPFFAASG